MRTNLSKKTQNPPCCSRINYLNICYLRTINCLSSFLPALCVFLYAQSVKAQSETFPVGTYIVNMGVTPQTVANGMRPYGMVYELLKTYYVPVKWVIGSSKAKDGIDFTYNSVNYRGGTFIIPRDYITSAVRTRLTYWLGQGVVMDTTTSSLTVNVTRTLTSAPVWTINSASSGTVTPMFTHASIPSSAYNSKAPSTLGTCDDIFALPHADPTWAAHGNLYTWNRVYKGAIWSGCHAVSVLENLVNPLNTSQRMNFLSLNGLIPDPSHNDGTPPYNYHFNRASYNGTPISSRANDMVFQFMGSQDAAHTNGSEQIYIPVSGSGSGWRSTCKIGCFDSTQSNVSAFPNGPAAVTLYGRGHGRDSSGYVMYQAGHNITGTTAANVAAMRQFFNFALFATIDKVPNLVSSSISSSLASNYTHTFSVNVTSPIGASLSYQWTSSCSGTFSAPTSATTNFTTNYVYSDTNCSVRCIITDACGRVTFVSVPVQVLTPLPVKLARFEAKLIRTDVQIEWVSTQEKDLFKYEVQRSSDGVNFEPIATIYTDGKQDAVKHYSHTDQGIFDIGANTLYYRLKAYDNNGDVHFGPVADIALNRKNTGIASLTPNPVSGSLLIQMDAPFSTFGIFEVLDVYGRVLYKTSEPELINSQTIRFDAGLLPDGVYFVCLSGRSDIASSARFVKY